MPPPEIRELRDLTRYRMAVIRERASEVNQLHKVFEDSGVKLATIATDIMGVSGRAMLEALVAGTTDPEVLAELAQTRLRARLPELRKALDARFREHHGFLVSQILAHVDYLDDAIAQVDERITTALELSQGVMTVLLSIPGIQRRTAEVVFAEIGTDMTRFPTSRHLASWAGLCHGNNESAGSKHGRTTKGSRCYGRRWLKPRSARPARTGYLQAKYRRVRSRRGHQRAVIAVAHAHAQLEIIHTLLSRGELTPTSAATSSNASRKSRSPNAPSEHSKSSGTRSSSTTQRHRYQRER